MNDNILTGKLRRFAELGNIDMDRCVEIAHAAHDALVEQSQGSEMPQLAAAMFRCCGVNEDEAAYFRCAVDSLLQEKWGAKPRDSAGLTGLMNMSYQGILGALRAGQEDDDDEVSDEEPPKGDVFTRLVPAGYSQPKSRQKAFAAEKQKTKSSGCLVIVGFIGILPLGFYAASHFLA